MINRHGCSGGTFQGKKFGRGLNLKGGPPAQAVRHQRQAYVGLVPEAKSIFKHCNLNCHASINEPSRNPRPTWASAHIHQILLYIFGFSGDQVFEGFEFQIFGSLEMPRLILYMNVEYISVTHTCHQPWKPLDRSLTFHISSLKP